MLCGKQGLLRFPFFFEEHFPTLVGFHEGYLEGGNHLKLV
jgi:hypothetical protein